MHPPWSLPLILTLLMLSGCTDEGTPPPDGSLLSLRALDASCTEVWLEVRLAAGISPRTITLQRDSLTLLTTTLRSTDTLIVDDGLLPNRRYTYTLSQPGGVYTAPAIATIVTMDTTSHEFTWQVDTLGATASLLNDVVIINDTLAYAVGAIYLRDSTGQVDPNAYNAAKWNGTSWELKRIPFIGPCSAVLYPPLKAVWSFSPTDILVTNGGSIVRYDGVNAVMDCRMNALLSGALNKIYATSPQDVFAVGNSGTIVHFDGSSWRRIESGTTLPIRGIHGSRVSGSEEYQILCVAGASGVLGGSRILWVEGDQVREVATIGLQSWDLRGIWFMRNRRYVAVGDGIWEARAAEGPWQEAAALPRAWKSFVYGDALNDLLAGGASILHFQGSRWQTLRGSVSLAAGTMKAGLAIAVGGIGNRAIAVRGRRLP